jgi:hypothetical protein
MCASTAGGSACAAVHGANSAAATVRIPAVTIPANARFMSSSRGTSAVYGVAAMSYK